MICLKCKIVMMPRVKQVVHPFFQNTEPCYVPGGGKYSEL